MTEHTWTWFAEGAARYTDSIEHDVTQGTCMPELGGSCELLLDPAAPIESGDLVRLRFDYWDGRPPVRVVKRLEATRAGGWYIVCAEGTAPLAIGILEPTSVERVIAVRPMRDAPLVPALRSAGERSREMYARHSADAAAEWAEHGPVRGVEFPRAKYVQPGRATSAAAVETSATLPDSDLQQPGTPENFEVETIASTIQFWWTEPEVWPLESKYQIYAAPWSLSDIASKELIWEGSDQGKSLTFSATSQWYFQIRAQHGNFHSSFVPNTYGIPALPQLAEPWSSGMWLFSTSPGFVAKLSSESTLITPPITGVIVNTAGTPVFSWTNPSSINVRINSPGAASTTFTGSGMSVEEVRQGYFFCNVSDAGNISSKSAHVYIERWSGDS